MFINKQLEKAYIFRIDTQTFIIFHTKYQHSNAFQKKRKIGTKNFLITRQKDRLERYIQRYEAIGFINEVNEMVYARERKEKEKKLHEMDKSTAEKYMYTNTERKRQNSKSKINKKNLRWLSFRR